MPVGSFSVAADVLHQVDLHRPKTVLDLGIGNGLNGCFIKNYFPDCRVYGIEGWGKYRNPMWDRYDLVLEKEIYWYFMNVPQVQKYDCVIMTDVLEHFEKPHGVDLLEVFKKIVAPNGIVLVSTPAIHIEQGAVGGNELETHRSLWTAQEFINQGYEILRDGSPCKYGHLMLLAKYTK